MKTRTRLFQLVSTYSGNESEGLYVAEVPEIAMSDTKVIEAIENAFNKNRHSKNVVNDAEADLEQLNIYRIFAQVATTSAI